VNCCVGVSNHTDILAIRDPPTKKRKALLLMPAEEGEVPKLNRFQYKDKVRGRSKEEAALHAVEMTEEAKDEKEHELDGGRHSDERDVEDGGGKADGEGDGDVDGEAAGREGEEDDLFAQMVRAFNIVVKER
jgi:hypothetical protein